jgi:sorting nexin-9/18/33
MAGVNQEAFKVVSLYDFESKSEVELGFEAGEELIVLRQDVGGGWWEGKRPGEQRKGLFPASYVKIVEQLSYPPVTDGSRNGLRSPQCSNGSEISDVALADQSSFENDFSSWQHLPSPNDGIYTGYATSGGLGGSGILNSQHGCTIVVGPKWQSDMETLSIIVRNPQKDSKLSGMKQFITYEVLSDVSTDSVKRRYKHFFWLHEQLLELFPGVCIPPVPEKQFTGRFEEDFIRTRQHFLESFLNNVARHPLLAASHAFSHFLTASGEKEWKSGKQMVRKSLSHNKPHSKHLGPTYLNDIVYPPNNVPHDRYNNTIYICNAIAIKSPQERPL